MKKHALRLFGLARSQTAKDTYVVFVGNILSAFLGFVFVLLVARSLSISEFGVFSSITNMIVMLASVADVGISSGVVKFVASNESKRKYSRARKYVKAAFVSRVVAALVISMPFFLAPAFMSKLVLGLPGINYAYWTGAISIVMTFPMFFFLILQAKKKFVLSAVVDNVFYVARLLFVGYYFLKTGLDLNLALIAFFVGSAFSLISGVITIRPKFVAEKANKDIYSKLLRFSGWLGVNRIISSVSGRIDIQMLAVLAGTTAVGLYSIPSRLASFIVLLTASFSSVLATRFSAFDDRKKEKEYLLKSSLALVPLVLGIVVWIYVSEPFILLLFGDKYLPSVPVFNALALASIPFLITAPSVSAIIYAIKKPIYMGIFSVIQLALFFLLNLKMIPQFGVFGPTITLGIVNSILAIYSWVIVYKHYWGKRV